MISLKLRAYLCTLLEIFGIGVSVYIVYTCFAALLSGEIRFGRTRSLSTLQGNPGAFWFAFVLQLALGCAAAIILWRSFRRRIALISKGDFEKAASANQRAE